MTESIRRSVNFLARTQTEAGAWNGDYGGSLFLTPAFVCACHVTATPIERDRREGFLRLFDSVQNDDGGFGLHIEAPSYLFTTVLTYVAMRILGRSANQPAAARARTWILAHGGAEWIPSWGKSMLAAMHLYDYAGMNPLPPELWLLPYAAPFHPGRFWCHCRVVFLPMSHLYGARHRMAESELIHALRREIYTRPWSEIRWNECRKRVAPTDLYRPHTRTLDAVNRVLGAYERVHLHRVRERALSKTYDQIRHEDETTSYIDIGPVNKLLNMMVVYFEEGGESERLEKHRARLGDYLWEGEDGLKMNGYNSTELWDTAFAAQAILASGCAAEVPRTLARAYRYVDESQVREDVPDHQRYYRHRSRGGWPFSNRPHGWPITDCTAEGLKTALLAHEWADDGPIADDRLRDAVDLILSFQNTDGGWATYELTRGPKWLEQLNASEVFADIMIDYSYVECTSACIQALALFRKRFPPFRRAEIDRAIAHGREFIFEKQRDDGSFEGSWGICFTYGTWFGVWGLLAAGLDPAHPAIRRACEFLLSIQLPDGGWGESWVSCTTRSHVPTEESQVVMTAWALLALLKADFPAPEAIDRGVALLRSRQRRDGGWPRERIAGIFNKNCAITYDNYRHYFPLWALGLHARRPATLYWPRGGP